MQNLKPCKASKTIYYPNKIETCFYNALKDFMYEFGCVYLSFVTEDTKKNIRLGYTSNPDWQEEYIGNKLIENCHLWKAVNTHFIKTNHEYLILPWSSVKPSTSKEKDILLYREEFDIGQGVSFCRQKNGIREFLAINPEKKNNKFESMVAKNIDLIRTHVKNFRKASSSQIIDYNKLPGK